MIEINNVDDYVHSVELGAGNYTRCKEKYRIIGYDSKWKPAVIQIREWTFIWGDVTCPECLKHISNQIK